MNRGFVIILFLLLMTNCKSREPIIDTMPVTCENARLILDTWGIDLPSWERENRNITYEIEGNRIFVTLASISPGYFSEWLYVYNPNVMFEESQRGILCHHSIPDIERFEFGKLTATWTFKQIKDKLGSSGHPLKDTFREYVALSFNSRNALDLNYSRSFEPTKFYYSMAFFMAVGRDNDFSDATLFTFRNGTYQDEPVIIIEVNGKYKNFYDFAQYPPLR